MNCIFVFNQLIFILKELNLRHWLIWVSGSLPMPARVTSPIPSKWILLAFPTAAENLVDWLTDCLTLLMLLSNLWRYVHYIFSLTDQKEDDSLTYYFLRQTVNVTLTKTTVIKTGSKPFFVSGCTPKPFLYRTC